MTTLKDSHFIEIQTPKVGSQYTTEAPKLTLQWRHLTLKANVKNLQTKQVEEKILLNNVSGHAHPGELVVIMGPSGAGKSTLLDCIAGRNDNVEGLITVNGAPWSKSMNRFTSYVMQDDLFYQTITVREHLLFQARLRMGKTHSVAQYTERVETVMEELGLTKCRDTLIGGTSLRGLSGGERKRLSFATEILTNPSLLFVDEPTSGLDSFMAETVVMQLQQLARDGRTVIATIHQPSSELFQLFDKLYLLSDGATVYHGKASDSVQYFSKLGFQCPPFLNPSDYFMRQLVVVDKATDIVGVKRIEKLKDEWRQHEQGQGPMRLESLGVPTVGDGESLGDTSALGAVGQMLVLAKRNVVRLSRDPMAFQVSIFQALFVSFLVGLIYLQLDLNQQGIQNIAGALFFVVVNETFSASNTTFITVPLELPIVIREYKAGLYRLFAWYISKNVSELPFQVFLPIVFFIPAFLLIGLDGGFKLYFYMQCILILVNSTAVGLGYMVSCVVRRVDLVPVIGVVLFLPFLLFGGMLINSNAVPDYFIWLQYLSPIKYGFEALMKIYWNQITTIPCMEGLENCSAHTGKDVLKNLSINTRSVWENVLILIAINIGFRVVGFVGLAWSLRKKSA